jgi:sensor histidine kinase YesM
MPAAPATLLLVRRYPFDRRRRTWVLSRLVAGSAVIYFAVTNTRYVLRLLPNLWLPDQLDRPLAWEVYVSTQLDRAPLDFLTYCGLFATSFAIDYHSKYRQRAAEILRLQLQAAQLQSELARAQLAALRGQLHPHFLFNAFNSVATLVRQEKNAAAVEMIANLGDLLRLAMENIDRPEVTLAQELEFVDCYLRVERVRFGPKLQVVRRVRPETLAATIPGFLLQPLVENAIKHGISQRSAPGNLSLSADRHGDRLRIEIANDGPSPSERPGVLASAAGIGLKNTRSRLQHAYGSDFRFEIASGAGGQTTATFDLPWRSSAANPAGAA